WAGTGGTGDGVFEGARRDWSRGENRSKEIRIRIKIRGPCRSIVRPTLKNLGWGTLKYLGRSVGSKDGQLGRPARRRMASGILPPVTRAATGTDEKGCLRKAAVAAAPAGSAMTPACW